MADSGDGDFSSFESEDVFAGMSLWDWNLDFLDDVDANDVSVADIGYWDACLVFAVLPIEEDENLPGPMCACVLPCGRPPKATLRSGMKQLTTSLLTGACAIPALDQV